MAGMFALYVVMHTPLHSAIAVLLGMKARECYFVCPSALTFSQLADSWTALAMIAAALLASWVVLDWFDGLGYERPLAFGLSTLGFVVIPAAVIGGVGEWSRTALLRPPLGPSLAALPALAFIAVGVQHGWRLHRPRLLLRQPSGLVLLAGGVALGLLVASIAASLTHPPTGGDAVSYHAPLSVFLWHDGNLGAFLDRTAGTWALANPGTAEIWYGLLLVAGGERLADLGQLPFALLGSVAVYAFSRRLRLGHGAAVFAGCAFLLVPMVVLQSGMQTNDLAGAALLMTVMALASAPVVTWNSSRLGLIGLGLGLVATTKLGLLPCVAGVGLFVVGAILWRYRMVNTRSALAAVAIVAVMVFIVAAPWWIRNIARYGNPIYPSAIPLIGRGVVVSNFGFVDTQFVPTPAAWPLYPLLEVHDDRSGFGALLILSLVPGFALAALRGRRQPIVLYVMVVAFMLPAWWKLTEHEPRFLLGICGLSFAFLPWSLLALPRRQRRTGSWLLALALLFSALVTLDQAVVPFALQPTARAEFYDRVWGVDPLVSSLPDSEGLLFNTGYADTIQQYAQYYALLGHSLGRAVIPVDFGSTDSIVATMRRAGIRYAYVLASPESWAAVEAKYNRARFQLVHMSAIAPAEKWGARRYLYGSIDGAGTQNGVRRYLYRLR
jgi:hypothetical protein